MSVKGGKVPGAGRKPGAKALIKKDPALEILSQVDCSKLWLDLLNCSSKKIRLEALKYLSDRAWGKALQATTIGNPDGSPIKSITTVYVMPDGTKING